MTVFEWGRIVAEYHVSALPSYLCRIWLFLVPLALLSVRWLRVSPRLMSTLNLLLAVAGVLLCAISGLEAWRNWYSQDEFERYSFINRYTGPYWWAAWRIILVYLAAQLFWIRQWRYSQGLTCAIWVWWVGSGLLIGWLSQQRDVMPSSWSVGGWLSYLLP